jgi:DNA-binding transcriptional ArsR family regulator
MGDISLDRKFIVTAHILKILDLIYREPGISISKISEKLDLPLSTTSTVIKHLKNFGLVEVEKVHIIKDIKVGDSIKRTKRYIRKVYPKHINCKNGVVILPSLHNTNGQDYVTGITVFSCPFYKECPYVGKYTLVPGKCKLYDHLSDEDRNRIIDAISKLEYIVKLYHELKEKKS